MMYKAYPEERKINHFVDDLNYQEVVLDISRVSLLELIVVLSEHSVNKLYRLEGEKPRFIYIENCDLHVIEDIKRDWPEDKDGKRYQKWTLITKGWMDDRIQCWGRKQYWMTDKLFKPKSEDGVQPIDLIDFKHLEHLIDETEIIGPQHAWMSEVKSSLHQIVCYLQSKGV